ncbi:THAP-type domain-containing protein [Nephila pilipes]|uniref:THAP-type domain-containing protein n=1 Tax=Nephila pilipes TaxID=299642 RepID=A0A8X6PI91_NEPPI|nr:THAP-type domain-containing protein [Nephila pilipes]
MVACCVPCCLSTKRENKDKSFHLFPTDPVKRKEWEKSIFGEGFNMELRIAYVCSKHFKSTDFTRMKFYNQKRKILKREAVPSISITNMKKKEPPETGPPFKRLKIVRNETKDKERTEIKTVTNGKKGGKVYSNAQSYGLKITHLKKMVNSRVKKIEQLEKSVSELNKKLHYYENNTVLQNMKKIMMLEEQGLGNTRTSFILTQVKNYDKKKPFWPENIIRESIILNEISPKAYQALIERKILQLPTKMTLHRYVKSGPISEEVPKVTEASSPEPEDLPKSNQNSLCYLVVDTATGNQHYIYGQSLPENNFEENVENEKNEDDKQDEKYKKLENEVMDDEEVDWNENDTDTFEDGIIHENKDEVTNENKCEFFNMGKDEIMSENEKESLIEYKSTSENEVVRNNYKEENEYEDELMIDYAEESKNDYEGSVNDFEDKNVKDAYEEEGGYDYEENPCGNDFYNKVMKDEQEEENSFVCEYDENQNGEESSKNYEENVNLFEEESVNDFELESVNDYEDESLEDYEEENDNEDQKINNEESTCKENQAVKLVGNTNNKNEVTTDQKKNTRQRGHPLIVFAHVAVNNQVQSNNNEKPS